MATHPLPPQTKNLTVNLHERAKAALGRLAFVRDMGSSELVRELIRRELEIAAVRGEIVRRVALEAVEALKSPKAFGLVLIGCLAMAGALPRSARRVAQSARSASVLVIRVHKRVGRWVHLGDGLMDMGVSA